MKCFRPFSLGSIPSTRSSNVSVRTFYRTDRYENQSAMVGFFVCEKIILNIKWRDGEKMKIIKEELKFEESLKQRLEFICEFSKVKPTFINGSIRKVEKTNLSYIEPHRIIIKNMTFLVFNYSNDVYISNLTKKLNYQN